MPTPWKIRTLRCDGVSHDDKPFGRILKCGFDYDPSKEISLTRT